MVGRAKKTNEFGEDFKAPWEIERSGVAFSDSEYLAKLRKFDEAKNPDLRGTVADPGETN
jgi:hypothetical protein